jgi:sugar phosphate permease
VLALLMFSVAEPLRGAADQLRESRERISMRGLVRNGAFWTATLGMAMMTFSLGGLSVWMPTFLSRMRSVPLDRANWIFGAITGFNAIVATLLGGWIGDRVLRRTSAAHYLVSGISMGIGLPAMIFAVHGPRELMWPAIFVAEFLLFLNTGPLNAAVVNSVGANIRARAVAVNLFVIHLLGDAFSPRLIGHISDHSNLQTGFFPAFIATALSSAVLFYGMRFAPRLSAEQPQRAGALA